jgi:coenzyme Q-binding protein COQ10
MPAFHTSRRVRHSAAEMFDLVADIEAYPQFVPLCRGLRVRRRLAREGCDIIIAEMEVGYKAIRETFTSRVTLDQPKLAILVEYIDGPFSHLENKWAFVDVPPTPPAASACQVDFSITYAFKSRTLGLLMGAMFDTAFRKFADAFEKRADEVYGRVKKS